MDFNDFVSRGGEPFIPKGLYSGGYSQVGESSFNILGNAGDPYTTYVNLTATKGVLTELSIYRWADMQIWLDGNQVIQVTADNSTTSRYLFIALYSRYHQGVPPLSFKNSIQIKARRNPTHGGGSIVNTFINYRIWEL